MKKIIFLALLMFAGFSMHSQAQCVSVIKNPTNNMIWGYVEGGTVYYDEVCDKILNFSTDGEVQDLENQLLATYSRTTGELRDLNNDLVMIVEPDGDILDAQSQLIAHVNENGVMTDADNYVLVSIPGADPFYIAYYYFEYRMF